MIQREIRNFEARMGWSKTKPADILRFVKKDARELNLSNSKHKLVDIIFECVQLANRKGIDVSEELRVHMTEARKKYSVKK
jgi:hypothetical protein